jgi:hypothetical protein
MEQQPTPLIPVLHEMQTLWQNVGNLMTGFGGTIEIVNKANHIGNLYVYNRPNYYIELETFIVELDIFIDQLPNSNLLRQKVLDDIQQNISYPIEFRNIITFN